MMFEFCALCPSIEYSVPDWCHLALGSLLSRLPSSPSFDWIMYIFVAWRVCVCVCVWVVLVNESNGTINSIHVQLDALKFLFDRNSPSNWPESMAQRNLQWRCWSSAFKNLMNSWHRSIRHLCHNTTVRHSKPELTAANNIHWFTTGCTLWTKLNKFHHTENGIFARETICWSWRSDHGMRAHAVCCQWQLLASVIITAQPLAAMPLLILLCA